MTMNDTQLEQELQNFDYSLIHPVKEKILENLLSMQRQRKDASGDVNILQLNMTEKLDFDTLDYVAAAGNANLHPLKDRDA